MTEAASATAYQFAKREGINADKFYPVVLGVEAARQVSRIGILRAYPHGCSSADTQNSGRIWRISAKRSFGLSESMRICGAIVSPLVSVHVVPQPIEFVRSLKEGPSALDAPQILLL